MLNRLVLKRPYRWNNFTLDVCDNSPLSVPLPGRRPNDLPLIPAT